jgi:plastocyanin
MTFRWLISFSLLLAAAEGETVTGRVRFLGKGPAGRQAVVWLEGAGAPGPAPMRAQMVQKGKAFVPHLLAVPVGSTVDFPNLDPIFHNAFSNFDGKVFDIGLYAPGSSRTVRLDRPGIVRIFCNIHPHMSAVIAVVPGPHYAVTGPDGSFRLTGVPAGSYPLRVFSELAAPEDLRAAVRTLEVRDQPVVDAGIIDIRTRAVVPPHKNKYGQNYPPRTPTTTDPYQRP